MSKYPRYVGHGSARLELFEQRGYTCEECRRLASENVAPLHTRTASEVHHALIRRDVRFPELNTEENYAILCSTCHQTGYVDTEEWRHWFWGKQCRRYGEAHMRAWLDALPLVEKPRF